MSDHEIIIMLRSGREHPQERRHVIQISAAEAKRFLRDTPADGAELTPWEALIKAHYALVDSSLGEDKE